MAVIAIVGPLYSGATSSSVAFLLAFHATARLNPATWKGWPSTKQVREELRKPCVINRNWIFQLERRSNVPDVPIAVP